MLKQKNVYPEYYDAVAAQIEPRPFPSPVNDPRWRTGAVDWFAQGKNVLEVGPGRGEFAEEVAKRGGPARYYIADMSLGMLNLVKRRIETLERRPEMFFLHADIDSDTLSSISDGFLDRIIMINAFQDVNPGAALTTFRRVIGPQGLLRFNAISRELREEYLTEDEDYDSKRGYFYHTRCPSDEMDPMGFVQRKSGEKVPYYRILKSYYRSHLVEMLRNSGFEMISAEPIILPPEVWLRAVPAKRAGKMEEIVAKFGGYPGSVDFIARPI